MTGLILKIESEWMDELAAVEFYTERDRAVRLEKADLVRVFCGDKVEYYATLDTELIGRGHLMARVEFKDKERMFLDGERLVVASGSLGLEIPYFINIGDVAELSGEKYKVKFCVVEDIPKSDAVVYCGVGDLDNPELAALTAMKEPGEVLISFNKGECIVVAVPYDWFEQAYKDNGLGYAVPFSETVKGRNGEVMDIDEIRYKIYGEFMVVGGELKLYIR